jgi:hypothetical protein
LHFPDPLHVAQAIAEEYHPARGAECKMLGAHGHSEWVDLSDFVVHFTKGGDAQGYSTVMSILSQRRLLRGPNPFGAARDVPELAESQRVVCFSEVPLGLLDRIVERRKSKFGLAFRKRFLLDQGGAPVWYLEHDTPQQVAFVRTMQDARRRGIDLADPIWALSPFVDFPSGPIVTVQVRLPMGARVASRRLRSSGMP